MKAVQVLKWGQVPEVVTVPNSAPASSSSLAKIQVTTVGVHKLVKMRAAGPHYTSSAGLPHTPGVDGVGVETSTGKRVYFHTFTTKSAGTLKELVYVNPKAVAEVPDDLDSVQAAALMNPAMSCWMALRTRVTLEKGWTCLIIGATSMSGRVAVKVAKHFGASKVYGAGRSESKLKDIEGLDGYVILNDEKPQDTQWNEAKDASVVLDYLYGPWPGVFLTQGKSPVQWVCIGSLAGGDAPVPGQVLRFRDATIRGSGPGSWSAERMKEREMLGMLEVLRGFDDGGEVKGYGVEDVSKVWRNKGERVVLTFGEGGK